MSPKQFLMRALVALTVAQAALWAPAAAQAQSNSREAAEAVRKYRAEQGTTRRATPPEPSAPNAPPPSKSWRGDAYRSGANPNADRNASLKSCMDNSGMNMAARDRCMRQHCEGRWGQGDCPNQGGDLLDRSGANNRTPLGRCLKEAGANPFKRDGCGWRHCNNKWDTPECAAIKPRSQPTAQ
ncbi:hypothetical protein [Ottowia oryzae]|uniref:Uncharacterized protein n=1 Tax=Ottowia oryzae TaxID=2109914 RepID=A0A2S0MAX5_9BURK|nr:hypothetical protein [Ottowia oryzae]AVO32883.1 hypothetical protein C6570_00360 [Ottowia oryzae]